MTLGVKCFKTFLPVHIQTEFLLILKKASSKDFWDEPEITP